MRKTEFAIDEYYHIFNRGVDKRTIFECDKDFDRFLVYLREFNSLKPLGSIRDFQKHKQRLNLCQDRGLASVCPNSLGQENLVEIIAYCLNPNHYHLILKQSYERGIEKYMQKIGTAHTMYFNVKYERSGSLFQGPFKSTHINSNELLLYLSVYVNAYHQIHGYPEKNWPYSSLPEYIGKRNNNLCQKEMILGQFNDNFGEYEKYLKDNAEYFKEKKEMEKYILE